MTEEGSAKQKNRAPTTQWEYETLLIGNDKLALSPALARGCNGGSPAVAGHAIRGRHE